MIIEDFGTELKELLDSLLGVGFAFYWCQGVGIASNAHTILKESFGS